ncbi:MAG: AAA family ATPase [Candidatus Micrarchaeaceae archaeon]|jgi:shikimate kinase
MGVIILFGEPGSGKSTIAKELRKQIKNSKVVEASNLIYSVSVFYPYLPNSTQVLLHKLKNQNFELNSVKTNREKARNINSKLQSKYSKDFIGKALDYLYISNNKGTLILSGARGYDTAKYFKNKGYFVVFLKTKHNILINRLAKKYNYSKNMAIEELEEEDRLYSTQNIEKIADLVIDTSKAKLGETTLKIINAIPKEIIECKRCVNTNQNPTITFNKNGYCNVCDSYFKNYDKKVLANELKFVKSFIGKGKYKWDAMVGVSGGKDSTNTLYETLKMGFKPLAFTFAIGYYPRHILRRGQSIAKHFGVEHEVIVVKKYMRKCDLKSYKKTAELYDRPESEELKKRFRNLYIEGRRHYSIKCKHALPFVRTCQLCRRLVIRGYYAEALKHGVNLVIIGINEWAGFSQLYSKNEFKMSGIRKLKPYKNKPAVYVIHLPFLLQQNSKKVAKALKELNWKLPRGEELIESNPNSCLFARAAQYKAARMLGFNPDTTRLAREVTVGFISKNQARSALQKVTKYRYSVSHVLKKAKIIM